MSSSFFLLFREQSLPLLLHGVQLHWLWAIGIFIPLATQLGWLSVIQSIMTSLWISSKGISKLSFLLAVVQIIKCIVNLNHSCNEFIESIGSLLPNQFLLDLRFKDFFKSCDVGIIVPVQVCDDLLKFQSCSGY